MGQALNPYKPRVLDLFCGAGGLAYGFKRSGYEIVAGSDFFKAACETFRHNMTGATTSALDIRKLDEDALREIGAESIDVIVGGPSCQGFSTSGGLSRKDGRDSDDPRNKLFLEYLRVVETVRPSWIVFENVPGLLLYDQGKVAMEISKAFNEIGYTVLPMILLAADYGVPQLRRRLIFVGNRTGQPAVFPQPTHGDPNLWVNYSLPFAHLSRIGKANDAEVLPHVTFEEACGDLPHIGEGETIDGGDYACDASNPYQVLMRLESDCVRQHTASILCEADRYAASTLKPGQNWRHLPEANLPARFKKIRPYDATTLLKRLEPNRPAYTITTKFNEGTTGAFIHPNQPRTISIREAARLQSFPDNYIFKGSDVQIRRQIGNAVPPLLATAVAEAILPYVLKATSGLTVPPLRAVMEVEADGTDLVGLHAARKQPLAA